VNTEPFFVFLVQYITPTNLVHKDKKWSWRQKKKDCNFALLFKRKLKHLGEYSWIQNFNIHQLVRNINQEAARVFVSIYLYELNSTFLTSVIYILVLYLTFEFLSSSCCFKCAKEEVINLFLIYKIS